MKEMKEMEEKEFNGEKRDEVNCLLRYYELAILAEDDECKDKVKAQLDEKLEIK